MKQHPFGPLGVWKDGRSNDRLGLEPASKGWAEVGA
jgi:hypothetical protein